MTKKKFDGVLALVGLSVATIFLVASASILYASISLIAGGGFWGFIGGVALAIPAGWFGFISAGIAKVSLFSQR